LSPALRVVAVFSWVQEDFKMRNLQRVAIALVCGCCLAGAVTDSSDRSTADIARLKESSCEMGRAYARQDLATLEELNAEDYAQTDTRGVVVTRAEYPQYVRQRTSNLIQNGVSSLSIDCDSIEVRLYGDAAVVTGGWTYTTKKDERNVVRRSRWTSMWTRYPKGWKRHAFQNTWVDPDANQADPNNESDNNDHFPHLWSLGAATGGAWAHAPKEQRSASDSLIRLEQMKTFYDPPGEYGYYTAGSDFGFETLALVISDTLPNAGPPLHQHAVEEAHVVLEGRVRYIIGGKVFDVTGPYVVRIPPGVPHAFLNVGSTPLHVIGVFPSVRTDGDHELGRNPLLPKQ
jgi:mannose-6-phosphate isomerase-like protein (cupin superfamily)/ketosteroid isomerase-like protein